MDSYATSSETLSETTDDLSALAWVHDELRRSLDNAHKSLRRFVKEADSVSGSDVDAVDPAVLRAARQQIHQGVGALELVGLPSAAVVLRATESAIQRFVLKPEKLSSADVDVIEQASFALLDFLQRMLSGKAMSPLALFPRYQAVQALALAERVHPADLWQHDWRWRDLGVEAGVTPHAVDAVARSALERQLLLMMRGTNLHAAGQMSDICASLGAGATDLPASTLWKLAAAFFESQAQGFLRPDVFSKRISSRILAQVRVFERGENEVSERLAQDLLFFCAQSSSPGDGRTSPRLAAVRHFYGLTHHVPTDYETSRLGRFDPTLIAQARKRVSSAKEAWSAVAGGEMHRLGGLTEQFALVGDSLKRLYPHGDALADELQHAVSQTQQANSSPLPSLAMEVATSVLYLEASLEDGDFDHPDEGKRVRRLAQRIASVRAGRTPDPLEAWMEELYRRVSDRQTMGSVVQELRASLSEAEKHIDQFFRNPTTRDALVPVPNLLASMRGVLSVLGMDQAAHAVLRMRDDVDGLMTTEVDPQLVTQSGAFDRLASNLGALGFLIDMLSVQPQVAKSLFIYDANLGTLSPLMGRSPGARSTSHLAAQAAVIPVEPRLIEQAHSLSIAAISGNVPLDEVARDLEQLSHEAQIADQPTLLATVALAKDAIEQATDDKEVNAARESLSEALADFVSTANDPIGLDNLIIELRSSLPPLVSGPTNQTTDLGNDPEMREIFLEEAREVIETAQASLGQLEHSPSDLEQLTTVRRAFHTLKGSSRMVGLKDFGEAAWSCEQIYNTWMAEQKAADPALLDFSDKTLVYLSEWIDAIASPRSLIFSAAPVKASAEALSRGDLLPVAHIAAFPIDSSQPSDRLDELEITGVIPSSPIDIGEAIISNNASELEFSFDLDLSEFEGISSDTDKNILVVNAIENETSDFELDESLHFEELSDSRNIFDLPLGSKSTDVEASNLPDTKFSELIKFDFNVNSDRIDLSEIIEIAPSKVFDDDDQVKVVGHLRIGIPLFNIYLNEADELSRKLTTEAAEWAMELHRPIGEIPVAIAHSLSGSSATVGFSELSHLARLLEHALMRSHAIGYGSPEEAKLFVDAAEEVRWLLHQFAAGFLKAASPELLQRLAEHELNSARQLEAATSAEAMAAAQLAATEALDRDDVDLVSLRDASEVSTEDITFPASESETTVVSNVELTSASRVDEVPPLARLHQADTSFAPLDTHTGVLGQAEFKPLIALSTESVRTPSIRNDALDGEDDIDAIDAVDAELFPIFEEEAEELLPQLAGQLREWTKRPSDNNSAAACMRTLHTLKGGARLAGAMRLGEMAHRLETLIEHLLAQSSASASEVEALQARSDALVATFEALRTRDAQTYADAEVALMPTSPHVFPSQLQTILTPPTLPIVPIESLAEAAEPIVHVAEVISPLQSISELLLPSVPTINVDIDWSRFSINTENEITQASDRSIAASNAAIRVRAPLLERLVNQAGEVSITRSRIEAEVGNIRGSLGDLTDNLERLRQQLRDIEFQAETQMISRQEAAKAAQEAFDPLESDRFTRFQELTRMMAESVNDVATVQRTLQRTLETTEDELAAQARLTRDLQDDLLRTRMVEFEGQSDRLYRVVRQAAKETGKQVRLDIVGGSIEVDRGVLDRMTPAFEHLLRNCVTHGIESPERRVSSGKDAAGSIVVAVSQEGNEVGVEFRDDGAGLNLSRIREKGVAMNLLSTEVEYSDAELANLIFTPGFSTAETITELSGRGVGMDVVRSEVNAMGGRIETATAVGQGTSFKLLLPLTTAVTQVVMVRCGSAVVAIPSTLIEIVRRATVKEIEEAYVSGTYSVGDRSLLFFWFGGLLQETSKSQESGRTCPIVIVRSAQQRVALHVDEVLGTQEVVVKNLGPQLSRLPGLAGMTLLASGAVALIYNPVALATLYGESARTAMLAAQLSPHATGINARKDEIVVLAAPLILVVDDSLTVRRVTQRLLTREGYRVVLAKDGIEALERLMDERPQVVLSDIEMPRMDGFDLVRNIRNDVLLRDLPVIMITSRIAQKHRDYAAELGVDHYLGKPYSEEDLLALIGRYIPAVAVA